MTDLGALVDAADEAALLRAVDGLCSSRDWDALVDLARRCREAVELGRQLWGVAMHVDYRLALEAPAPYAAAVLRPGAGRFALGPLTEVAAGGHRWADLAPHIGDAASAAAVAQERVLRDEDLRATDAPAELPLCLAPFEPSYALPVYRDRSAEFPQPPAATRALPPAQPLQGAEVLADDDAVRALSGLVEGWTSESSGRVAAVAVEGEAAGAVGCFTERASLLALEPADALALLQWAGASGGAHGRRRGGAAGRFSAWWAAAALGGVPWPERPSEQFVGDLGAALAELRWFRWRPAEPERGWVLRLAVHDPVDGLAWAVQAIDEREELAAGA